jgi:hypothetical protein
MIRPDGGWFGEEGFYVQMDLMQRGDTQIGVLWWGNVDTHKPGSPPPAYRVLWAKWDEPLLEVLVDMPEAQAGLMFLGEVTETEWRGRAKLYGEMGMLWAADFAFDKRGPRTREMEHGDVGGGSGDISGGVGGNGTPYSRG